MGTKNEADANTEMPDVGLIACDEGHSSVGGAESAMERGNVHEEDSLALSVAVQVTLVVERTRNLVEFEDGHASERRPDPSVAVTF